MGGGLGGLDKICRFQDKLGRFAGCVWFSFGTNVGRHCIQGVLVSVLQNGCAIRVG